MYRPKPSDKCDMPAPDMKIRVLVLNGSLKHKRSKDISNTEELSELVIKYMSKHGKVDAEIIRLADKNILTGLRFREGRGDDWPSIAKKIRETDILIMATPIWWGGRSSLMQRVIERLDAFDEEHHKEGRSALYNKVAGVVITGSEDGAQSTLASILEVMMFMGFTLPPESCAYWVGEVGQDPKNDRARRLKNKSVKVMAEKMARNLLYYSQLLKLHPLIPIK
jgi:multimeric flavodoxin WrbA